MFDHATRVTRVEHPTTRLYRSRFDQSWLQNPAGVYGGLTAATLLRAMQVEAGSRPARTLTVQLTAPVPAEELLTQVTVERMGSSTSFLSARLATAAQPDKTVAHAMATFATNRATDLDEHRWPVPHVAPPSDVKAFAPVPGVHPPFMQHFETRFCLGAPPFTGAADGRIGAWLRPVVPASTDAALMAALLDVMPAAALSRARTPRKMSSVCIEWRFLGDAPPSHSGHWLVDATSLGTAAGFSDHEARLFVGERCVAVSRQMFALLD